MLKRQESSLSASRRQAAAAGTTPPPPETHHAKAIGCMSGIIHLFSKYQNSNRRLTFGKKQEKRKPPQSPTRSAINGAKNSARDENSTKKQAASDAASRLTCAVKVLRSPTLPPEIRRSSATGSPENSRTPPSSLVARLMGLEDLGAASKRLGLGTEDAITEKRQRLMQALEKCNEDLEALKRIIKAVQTADVRLQPPRGDSVAAQPCMKMCTESAEEKPNISADESSPSPVSSHCLEQNSTAEIEIVAVRW
ncbi:uncharacterized protein LOC131003724 isoform X2 [Salvia miltiorrhiza]|uniref:uncharacterized protein LOC131003724 isoform X2 n=1 Tax=Salvia miltiorrhiza TaxID=226208 RepID=UPI0025ACFAA9|nr:uncharacterized protein LOC131003724 isoform X2 [Salvia miltiorrhiza]